MKTLKTTDLKNINDIQNIITVKQIVEDNFSIAFIDMKVEDVQEDGGYVISPQFVNYNKKLENNLIKKDFLFACLRKSFK